MSKIICDIANPPAMALDVRKRLRREISNADIGLSPSGNNMQRGNVSAAAPFLLNRPKIAASGSLLIDRRLSPGIASAIGTRKAT
jgi:hypothetical protein